MLLSLFLLKKRECIQKFVKEKNAVKRARFLQLQVHIFNNYPAKSRGISSDT